MFSDHMILVHHRICEICTFFFYISYILCACTDSAVCLPFVMRTRCISRNVILLDISLHRYSRSNHRRNMIVLNIIIFISLNKKYRSCTSTSMGTYKKKQYLSVQIYHYYKHSNTHLRFNLIS